MDILRIVSPWNSIARKFAEGLRSLADAELVAVVVGLSGYMEFGVPAMLQREAIIQASCSDCGLSMQLEVADGKLKPTQGMVHFAVPAAHWWDEIVFT